jgi:multiple sugar transport system permease protein
MAQASARGRARDGRAAAAPTARGRPLHGSPKRAEARFGVLLALPPLLAFGAVILYPFLNSVGMSLFRVTLLSPDPVFAGLRNFERLFEDAILVQTWLTTVLFVVVTTAATFALGFAWALVLNERFRFRAAVRSASLLPWVLPSTVTAFLWAWMFNAQYGVINAALMSMGAIDEPIAWLATPEGAMAGVVVAKTWLSIPLFTAFLLAGLQSLPGEQVEAARIDGASNAQVIRHVALPHLKPTIVVLLVLGAMGNLQQFDVIYAMTGGGPLRATTVLSIEVHRQAFESWNIGIAAAVGVIWFLTIAGPAYVYLRSILGRR